MLFVCCCMPKVLASGFAHYRGWNISLNVNIQSTSTNSWWKNFWNHFWTSFPRWPSRFLNIFSTEKCSLGTPGIQMQTESISERLTYCLAKWSVMDWRLVSVVEDRGATVSKIQQLQLKHICLNSFEINSLKHIHSYKYKSNYSLTPKHTTVPWKRRTPVLGGHWVLLKGKWLQTGTQYSPSITWLEPTLMSET